MTIQTLVSGVQLNIKTVAETMNLQTDTIVINQTDSNGYDEYEYKGHKICCYDFAERGVGLSRNNALMRATSDIILFSDEDIVYVDGYADAVIGAYRDHPEADMILLNVKASEGRETYHIDSPSRVHRWNCGRYPTYSFSCRRESIQSNNITFNLLFGGGARYQNGEDSLFIDECLRKGLKVYALPIDIGREVARPSTWFKGYNERFFHDRGVLYQYLYGNLAVIMALRFLNKRMKGMFDEMSFSQAFKTMKKGMREAKK